MINFSNYQIVIPDGATETVEGLSGYELKAMLSDLGYSLDIVSDSASVKPESVLVGNTAATVGALPTGNNYSVKIDTNGRIQLAAGSYYGYRAAIEYLASKVENGCVSSDLNYTGDASESLMTAPDGALRVMFYNLYGYDNDSAVTPEKPNAYNGTRGGPIAIRHQMQLDMIASYSPDVICFQEYVSTSHNVLTAKLADLGYTELDCGFVAQQVNGSTDSVNDTPIFYRSDRLTPVKAGYLCYSATSATTTQNCNNANTKSLTWGVFTEKTSGKSVIVVSTHLMYNENGTNHDAARQANVVELMNQIDTITAQYPNIPIILGGDLNSGYTSAPFNDIVSDGFTWMNNAQGANTDTLGMKGFATYSFTDHLYTVCPNPPATGYGIDHAFYSGNVSIINYLTLTDRASLLASDHCPKLADIILN